MFIVKISEKMVEYKNQHYVPRFYLRNFNLSSRNEKTFAYHLGNIENQAYPQSIKSACSDDDFYTQANPKDRKESEQLLSKIENEQSNVLKKIINSENIVHPYNSTDSSITFEEYETFLQFIAFQSLRTKSRKEGIKNLAREEEETFRSSIDIDSILLILLDGLFQSLAFYHNLLRDLCPIMIKNESEIGFLTSDNPVVCDNLRFKEYGAGFSSRGLIVYLPLSPKIAILLYDTFCYSIPTDFEGRIKVKNDKTIKDLNTYQILNAKDCIFFSDSFQHKRKKEIEINNILETMEHVRTKLQQRSYPPQYVSKPFIPLFPQIKFKPWRKIMLFEYRFPNPIQQKRKMMEKWFEDQTESKKELDDEDLFKKYKNYFFVPEG